MAATPRAGGTLPGGTLLALLAGLYGGGAFALDNDPKLSRLCSGGAGAAATPCGDAPVPDQKGFENLAREYGMAIAPRLLAPAETTGVNGFQFDFSYGVTSVNGTEDYWTNGVEDGTGPSTLHTLQVGFTKGLPYSVDLGGNITYLFLSEMLAYGASGKWALNEAVDDFPVDFALRGAFNRVVGSVDLDLTTASMDVIISRSFGGGGMANIAPYLAYEPVWVIARSGVLDTTPGDPTDPSRSFVFAESTQASHRVIIGTRFILGAANFTPEVALTKGLQSYNFKLGLDF